MSKEQSWVPWYRRKDYDGNLSEEEKRILDSFRMKDKHPATSSDDLPSEVQGYISAIEFELYHLKQDTAAGNAVFLSALSALAIYFGYHGHAFISVAAYLLGAFLFVAALLRYRRVWKKNSEEFSPKLVRAPHRTDEGIQTEWELDYIVRMHRRKSELEDTP